MNAFNHPVFALTFCLIGGILLEPWSGLNLETAFALCIVSLLLALVNHWFLPRLSKLWSSISLYLHFICIGLLVSLWHYPLSNEKHYISYEDQEVQAIIQISDVLRPTSFAQRFEGEVKFINEQEASGKLLIQLTRDSTAQRLNKNALPQIDDLIAVTTKISKINTPRNPFAFDYSAYLENKGIYGQIYTNTEEIYNLGSRNTSALGFAAGLRLFFQEKLKVLNMASREWGVVNALLLGQRHELSADLREQYASAGVIHILAVSGLHVGIVLYLLQLCLKPMGNNQQSRLLRALLCIAGVWCFATLTGLSPSALRAATMFSFLQIGLSSLRKNGGMNGLVASAFFLLIIDPFLIYQVGFQLSYAAVFFILWLQPLFLKLWNPSKPILRYFWGIASVSITAQLGVLPLSLYYFHQFSLLFLVSNLVILPVLFIILSMGFFILIFASFDLIPAIVAKTYEYMIYCMNEFISWSSGFKSLILQDIYFNAITLLVTYLILFTAGRFIHKPDSKYLYASLCSCLLLIFYLNYEKWNSTARELYILHDYRSSLLIEQNLQTLEVYAPDSTQLESAIIKDFMSNQLIEKVQLNPIKNYIQVNESELLVIDSSAVFEVTEIDPQYILLRQSPQINLKRVIKTFPEACIIADGSNYRTAVLRWQRTCEEHNIPFHNTYENGYLKIE